MGIEEKVAYVWGETILIVIGILLVAGIIKAIMRSLGGAKKEKNACALMTEAIGLEIDRKHEEALQKYQEIATRFKDTEIGNEAQKNIDSLKAKLGVNSAPTSNGENVGITPSHVETESKSAVASKKPLLAMAIIIGLASILVMLWWIDVQQIKSKIHEQATPKSRQLPLGAIPVGTKTINYVSPDGYSFDYPDTWEVVRKEVQGTAGGMLREHALADAANVSSKDSCFVAERPNYSSTFSISYFFTKGQTMEVNAEDLLMFKEAILLGSKRNGRFVSDVQTSMPSVGGYPAFSVKCNFPREMVQGWTLLVPVGEKTYNINCTSSATDYPRQEEVFRQIIESIKFR